MNPSATSAWLVQLITGFCEAAALKRWVLPTIQAVSTPPPEPPEPYEEAEPAYTREDEERDMITEARDGEKTADRRDATEVAMDLLATELGAKPL